MPLTSVGESAHQSAQGASAIPAKSRKSVSDGIRCHLAKHSETTTTLPTLHASDEVVHVIEAHANVAAVLGPAREYRNAFLCR